MNTMDNHIKAEFTAKEANVSLARIIAASFIARLDPTLNEAEDVKVSVSEAVTNAIVHAYDNENETIIMEAFLKGNELTVTIEDKGKGIEDIEKAKQPLFTTKPEEERSGLGFTVMESFMDSMTVVSKKGEGTKVTLTKKIGRGGNA